jgi:PAS domain S-box-containing protein
MDKSPMRLNIKELQNIFDLVSEGIIVSDADSGEFIIANKSIVQKLGYQQTELSHLKIEDIHPKDKISEAKKAFVRFKENPDEPSIILPVIKKDQTTIPMEIKAKYIIFLNRQFIIGTFKDATEIVKSRENIATLEERFLRMAESLDVGLTIIENNQIVFLNNRVCEIFGVDKEQLSKKSLINFAIPEEKSRIQEIFQNTMKTRIHPREIEVWIQTPTGQRKCIQNVYSIKKTNDEILNRYIITTDITERVRIQQDIEKTNKLDALGLLAGGIAHDFNNLLAVILGNISLCQLEVAENSEILTLLKESEKGLFRAKSLTQQLLTFAKGGNPVKTQAIIEEIVRESAEFVLRGSNVLVNYNFKEDLYMTEIDPGQISQVIQNLVLNAKDAMTKGGTITITISNITNQEKKQILISITDTGQGIPNHIIPKIFDPYFTTKSKGTGLGLSVVYSIIKKHQGEITVESVEGIGTTFHILLPAVKKFDSNNSLNLDPQNTYPIIPKSTRFLIMDDEDQILLILSRMLTYFGIEPIIAHDGNEAIEICRNFYERGTPITYALMDLTIRGKMGGKEALEKIKAAHSDFKAIVMSGYSDDIILTDFQNYGFKGFITKPFTYLQLKESIEKSFHCTLFS